MKILKYIGFNKSQTTVVEEKTVKIDLKKNYPKEVLEIHHEFEIASDKLLENAYSIINSQPIVNESKVERLAKFGFKQVKEVVETSKVLKITKLSKEQIELVQYYKQNYPFNKFINEEQVQQICHKYNLVCGNVDRFRGFVPDANLKDIEKFKLKEKEENGGLKLNEIYIIKDDWTLLNINEINNEGYSGKIDEFSKRYLLNYEYIYSGIESSSKATNVPGWGKTFQYRLNNIHDKDIKIAIERNTKSFQICAPIKDMDISGLELSEGYKLQRKIEIPDPVVLQPVKGGYLIVTAWGDEASDAIVVNEINN